MYFLLFDYKKKNVEKSPGGGYYHPNFSIIQPYI